LTFLDICGHAIGDYGATLLAQALSVNTSLLELHYDGNHITYNGWSELAFCLEKNHHILFIGFPRNDFVSYASYVSRYPDLAMFVQKASSALEEIRCICLRNNKEKKGVKDDDDDDDDSSGSSNTHDPFKTAARVSFGDLELRDAVLALPNILEKNDEVEPTEERLKQFRASKRFSIIVR